MLSVAYRQCYRTHSIFLLLIAGNGSQWTCELYDTSNPAGVHQFQDALDTIFYLGNDLIMIKAKVNESSSPANDVDNPVTMTTKHYESTSLEPVAMATGSQHVTMDTSPHLSNTVTMGTDLKTSSLGNTMGPDLATNDQTSTVRLGTSTSRPGSTAESYTWSKLPPTLYMGEC